MAGAYLSFSCNRSYCIFSNLCRHSAEIPLPCRALSATVRRSMSIDHSLREVHVSSNNLCRFPQCGFPGCEPNVLEHLCIPTEFLWYPSHCSDLLNSSFEVYHQVRIIDFTLAFPNASGKSRFPLAATRVSAISPLYSRPKMSLYDDPP